MGKTVATSKSVRPQAEKKTVSRPQSSGKKAAVKKPAAKKKKSPEKKPPVEKRPVGHPAEWDPVLLARQLEEYCEAKYDAGTLSMDPNTGKFTVGVPLIEDFCFLMKNPVSGKRLGKNLYHLAEKCPELSDAIHACKCARTSKIDAGAIVGAINPSYAALAQRQTSAGGFTEKTETEHSGSIGTHVIRHPSKKPIGADTSC